jgi:HEPN domain-containing protein/predicted nucleotidyltransferase
MTLAAPDKTVDDVVLARVCDAVRRIGGVRAIYLFGSRARGTAAPHSDYDILVVTWQPVEQRPLEAMVRAEVAGLGADVHVFVVSAAEFEWRKRFANTLERAADREGLALLMEDALAERRAIAQEWFDRGDRDMAAAHDILAGSRAAEAIAFHAQQCIEKYLKGFLTLVDIEAERTHDLARLTRQCARVESAFGEWVERVADVSRYAVETRYPDPTRRLPTEEEARRALGVAEDVRAFVRDCVTNRMASR